MATRKPTPRATKAPKKAKAAKTDSTESRRRFWITFPPARIQSPVIWELGHRFPLVTNIRQASITEEVGIVCLEVSGPADSIHEGLRWLKRMGLSVEPVELSAVES